MVTILAVEQGRMGPTVKPNLYIDTISFITHSCFPLPFHSWNSTYPALSKLFIKSKVDILPSLIAVKNKSCWKSKYAYHFSYPFNNDILCTTI